VIGENNKLTETAKTLLHEMDLKVAELVLIGAVKYVTQLIVKEIACWLRTARASEGHLLDRDHVNF
jgi:hypothetical protein